MPGPMGGPMRGRTATEKPKDFKKTTKKLIDSYLSKYKIPIITKSTFNNKPGTVISDIIEENTIKSIVKKDLSRISIVGNGIVRNIDAMKNVLDIIQKNKLDMLEFDVTESKISITFKNTVEDNILEEIQNKLIKEESI